MGKLTISIAMLNSYVSLPEGNRLPEIHWLIIMCPVEMAPFWGVYPSSSAFRQTHSYGDGSKPSLSHFLPMQLLRGRSQLQAPVKRNCSISTRRHFGQITDYLPGRKATCMVPIVIIGMGDAILLKPNLDGTAPEGKSQATRLSLFSL